MAPPALRFVCLTLAALLLGACSEGERAAAALPDALETAAAPADAPAPPPTPAAARPERPERNFSDRRPSPGPWYEAFLARVDPVQDGWLTEVVATAAEGALREALEEALEGGDEAFARILWRDFQGADALRPSELELVREAPPWHVQRAAAPPATRREHGEEKLVEELRELVLPLRAATARRVEVDVTSILVEEGQQPYRFELSARIRLACERGAAGLQVNTTWRMGWCLGAKGKRLGLEWLEVDDFEQVEARERPFSELTRHVLGSEPLSRERLELGSLEYWKRVDRIAVVNNVYLGMHGMGVGDVDGDGREDLYLAQQAGLPNLLLLSTADGRVRERGAAAEVDFLDDTTGVLIVDLDGDGARDLVLGMGSGVLVAWNDGSGRFARRTRLDAPGTEQVYSISAADADGDGDLDLYATRYVAGGVVAGVPTPYHDAENGASNVYWRAEGERRFVDATAEVGLDQGNNRFSLVSLWEDFDGDGDLDLYVANDFGRNNLYRNEGGNFVDVAATAGVEDMAASMGISVADVDVDGDLDLYVSNMFTAAGSRVTAQPAFLAGQPLEMRAAYAMHTRGNTLLLAQGDGRYRDATEVAGVGPGGWAWGAMFMDFENDGLADLVVPNGFLTGRQERDLESFFWRAVVGGTPAALPPTDDYRHAWIGITTMTQREELSWNGAERNYAYANLGAGRFVDVSAAAGLDHADDARVASVLDWDGDGGLDLWLRNRTAPALRFLRGRAGDASWVSVDLVGRPPNTDAVGALVTVHAAGRSLARRVYAGEGYLGCSSHRLHFGLADAERIERIDVRWPDGSLAQHTALPVRRRIVLSQGSQTPRIVEPTPSPLAQAPHEYVAAGRRPDLERVPLLDNLPLSSIRLPRFEGAEQPLSELLPARVLLVLWASYDERSEAELARLAGAQARLAEADVVVHPLTLDEVQDQERARAAVAASGLARPGGRLDRRARTILEAVLVEVLGGYEDLPLPVGLLLDGAGAVSVLYVGGIDPERVADDARRLGSEPDDPLRRWPTALSGGRWAGEGPLRSLGPLADFLRRAGFAELADELERERARREDR